MTDGPMASPQRGDGRGDGAGAPPLRVLVLEHRRAQAQRLCEDLEATPELSVALEWVDRLSAGLERLAAGDIDVTVLGLPMPDGSGLDSFRAVRDRAPEIPMIILADDDENHLAETALREGAQDYLLKPEVSHDALVRSLRHAMARQALIVELRQLAMLDELTGLHNRRGFIMLARQLLEAARRNGFGTSLVYMDINGLKAINDTLGHRKGDEVFIALAHRLRQTFRSSDVVARIGGDEFCALLVADGSRGDAPIRRLLEEPAIILFDDGSALTVSLSVGIANSEPSDDVAVEDLMHRADASMYEDKYLRMTDS